MGLEDLSLLDLVPALGGPWGWVSPFHLADWCGEIEGCLAGHKRVMLSVPYQHHKSTTTMVGVIWLLLKRPSLRIILMTHSHDKARAMSKDIRDLWKLAGGKFKEGHNTIEDWQTPEGGGCVAMSAQQSKLGYPCDLLLVDDPLDELEYMMASAREHVDRGIALYTARTATHLDVVLMVASRWHTDDPVGRRMLRDEPPWVYHHHPGISVTCVRCEKLQAFSPVRDKCARCGSALVGNLNMRAFAPDVMDLDRHLRNMREWQQQDPSLNWWHAQVQNDPIPDAVGFFVGETPYIGPDLPAGTPIIFGVDAAFTPGPKRDFFAVVGLADVNGQLIVFHAERHQNGLRIGVPVLQRLRQQYPFARFVTYASGPEVGVYHSLFEWTRGEVQVETMPARWSKGYRAQKCAMAWSGGQILVRGAQRWTGPLVAELHTFDGSDGNVDDQADCLVAAYDAMMAGRLMGEFGSQFTFGRALGA